VYPSARRAPHRPAALPPSDFDSLFLSRRAPCRRLVSSAGAEPSGGRRARILIRLAPAPTASRARAVRALPPCGGSVPNPVGPLVAPKRPAQPQAHLIDACMASPLGAGPAGGTSRGHGPAPRPSWRRRTHRMGLPAEASAWHASGAAPPAGPGARPPARPPKPRSLAMRSRGALRLYRLSFPVLHRVYRTPSLPLPPLHRYRVPPMLIRPARTTAHVPTQARQRIWSSIQHPTPPPLLPWRSISACTPEPGRTGTHTQQTPHTLSAALGNTRAFGCTFGPAFARALKAAWAWLANVSIFVV
jgi:hypothetical protein